MERKYGEKKISAIVCIVIFFGVIAFSAGIDILEDHAVSGARKDLSFVTECGDNAVMTSYVLTDYEDDGTVVRNGPEGSHKMTFTCNVDWGEEVIPDILDILEEKVKEGVDVRVMYDDVGCIFNLPSHYADFLRKKGIKCIVFNRYIPIFSTVFNNRDHRKILVIDGDVAFTGGINFADEYINEKQRFGYWKDNGVRITGKAVYSMTQMFLQMWNAFALEKDKLDYEKFCLEDVRPLAKEERGIVLPYSDHPLDSEFVGESVYINLINSAQKYIYFFTPYLIIDNEVVTALILAAKRGVDVRIITPGIPDKKMIFLVTQSYYPQLVEGGVQIFQYRPGFVHAKCAVCDDKIATVGTINLDYRSLYLHFENGLFLYNNDTVMDIKKDILDTLEDCNRIMPEMCKKNMFFLLLQGILRIFAPLL